ncbi:ABC transporter ATP-binding protein [Algoriphagus kandeliae]|uniref:ABC transporter ATP-binding protein n=1 Tax=Algoriphagus kandeliae TaxID=2562278 RepID=A0A4Y9QXY6_9BACT|nr:ABC transporter ATP-binding protein [Algoriphagus kandeliae]TFV97209.1 ABC transporter ATP-binding protein [Algoriphagus kandeliae]
MYNQVRYFKFFFKYLRLNIFVLLFLSILVGLMDGFGLSLFIPLIQAAAADDFGYDSAAETLGDFGFLIKSIEPLGIPLSLSLILSFLVILFLFKGFFKYLEMFYRVLLQIKFVRKIRYELVDGLGKISYESFLKINGGRIQNTMSGEVNKVISAFGFYFNTMQGLVLLLVYIFLAFLSNFQFALMVSIGGYLTSFLFKVLYKKTRIASIEITEISHVFQSLLVQSIHFFKYLKATSYFNDFKSQLKGKINDVEKVQKRIGNYNAILISSREPIVIFIVVLVIWIQTKLLGASLTSIILSILFFYRALNYLLTVQTSWQGFVGQIGAVEAAKDLIQEFKTNEENLTNKPNLIQEKLGLHLKEVFFNYDNSKNILSSINLNIEPNKTYAFVGLSGGGKTSLVNLIIGLLSPKSGFFLVNGKSRGDYNLDSYRRKFGYITQEPVIFNDTIYNNVTFWASKTPENLKLFWEVLELAHLKSVVLESSLKEDTNLGDNGMLFSGGQKQRISIARELFKRCSILIFDEATSALDSETERIIQKNIESLKGKYTIIVIAHRLSTVKNADQLILLDKGEIISIGTFDEVYESSQAFQRMVNLQEF